ncbi:MAG: hypothetical protein FIA92_13045, partial [Chloroflexi bacterium]|nr:hypothetical protein [Chloroflexota bacterium]
MTGSARTLGSRHSPRRSAPHLSARAHAILEARRARRPRRRSPILRIVGAVVLSMAVVGGAVGGTTGLIGAGVIESLAARLPDPTNALDSLSFSQPTILYDRTGTVELARFERERRRVVTFAEVPPLVLDATTTAEDRTFWDNDGFDPAAIAAAVAQNLGGERDLERGASTITQQLVRARFLPADVLASDRYLRKTLEILQAARLTEAYPGEEGKQKIITAYLNEIYYGHRAYGIAAAARIYFGVEDLSKLTPSQAALLAGLPQAPSSYDPYQYAVKDDEGRLVVPKDSPPVLRRNYVLQALNTSRWTTLTPSQLQDALDEPVVLAGEQPQTFRAPHFSWAVRRQLDELLGGPDAVEMGGYRVVTTLDWDAQQLAERYALAGGIIPNLPREAADKLVKQLDFSKHDRRWIESLRGKDIHNAALVAIDYKTGEILAYAGSAGYEWDELTSKKFSPEYDVAAAYRQPGAAFKPFVYAAAFEANLLTPGSLLLDISTRFGKEWAPKNADRLERGPVDVRYALQQSLNLPAIRALERVGNEAVGTLAESMGVQFAGGHEGFLQSGLAGAIGTVETRIVDLTSAFGALGNGGAHVDTQYILSIEGPDGSTVYQRPAAEADQVLSPQSAYLVSDILAGNTDPRGNPFWAEVLQLKNGPDKEHRPAAVKTGTSDNNRDFGAYGYLPPYQDGELPSLAVGVWMGNSDHSEPRTKSPPTSLATGGEVWHAFVRDLTAGWPVAKFQEPDGIVHARQDRWSGGKPGPWTRDTVREVFKKGTEPGAKNAIDPPGLLYRRACGTWMVDPVKAELGPKAWDDDIEAWLRRARRGDGVKGPLGSITAHQYDARSWGGPLVGPCREKDDDKKKGGRGEGNGGGSGGGNGGGNGGGGGRGGGGGGGG